MEDEQLLTKYKEKTINYFFRQKEAAKVSRHQAKAYTYAAGRMTIAYMYTYIHTSKIAFLFFLCAYAPFNWINEEKENLERTPSKGNPN